VYDYRRGEGVIKLNLRSTSIGSDYDYAQINLSVVNSNYLSRFVIKTRFFAQWGTGNDVAPESALYLAGANPEEMMENKYVRSAAFFPQQFNGYGNTTNNFQFGGGLNLRGYNGYLTPFERPDGSIIAAYRGNTGAAGNIEIEFDQLFRIRPKLTRKWLKINTYLFGDIGVINANLPDEKLKFAEPRADAGLGVAATIKKWGPLALEKPLTIRFDMPFLLTRTPNVSPDYVQFRWLIGVNRAF
jgi:aminopeptidase N